MAWRIEESVIRGELNNRIRDRVTGRIWLVGFDEPVQLDLAGNAWRDLAGRRLEFVNPDPKPGDLGRFVLSQTGTVGDCTASRRVKVPEIPMDQIGEYYAARKPWPWHWANSLYFEWFSGTNGRVVIESATFHLRISSDIAWTMTSAEEESQRRGNSEAMGGFLQQLGEAAAIEADFDVRDATTEEFIAETPRTEAKAKKNEGESPPRDRSNARMQRAKEDSNDKKIPKEELKLRDVERESRPSTQKE